MASTTPPEGGRTRLTPAGYLRTPEPFRRANYKTLIAPYRRFRASNFYTSVAPGGTYTADIQGCPWNCNHCWSNRGWVEEPVLQELEPEHVVRKLVAGMGRNGNTGARISGGDVAFWWPHVRAVIDLFLEATTRKRMRVPGITSRRGEPMRLVLETAGGMTSITPDAIGEIEAQHGEQAKRLVLAIGMKASNPVKLAELTGQPPRTAAAAHRRQLDLVLHVARRAEHVQQLVSFLDRYSDIHEVAALQAEIEAERPDMHDAVSVARWKPYVTKTVLRERAARGERAIAPKAMRRRGR